MTLPCARKIRKDKHIILNSENEGGGLVHAYDS